MACERIAGLRPRALPLSILAGTASVFVVSTAAVSQAVTPSIVAFVDVTVIPMDQERVLPQQTVVVQNDRIVALGPSGRVTLPAGAIRIDGRGKFLLPGLADMHTHVSRYTPKSIDRVLLLLLANGVTTIRNVEFLPLSAERAESDDGFALQDVQIDGPAMLRLRDEIRAGRRWGPRIYLSSAWHLDSTKSIEQNVLAYKAAGYDFIKIYYDSPAERDTLIPVADRLGLPLVAHGVEADFPRTLQMHLKSIEHLAAYPLQTPDSVRLPEFVATTVRQGIWNCPCPNGYAGTAPGPLETRYGSLEARLAHGIDLTDPAAADNVFSTVITASADELKPFRHLIKALQDAGAGLLLGSDLPFTPPGFSVFRGLQGFVQAGLTPYQALLTGTRNVAAYWGTLDSAGTVAVGKRADLLLLDANPLDDIQNAGQIAGVMAAGRWSSLVDIETRLDQYYRGGKQP